MSEFQTKACELIQRLPEDKTKLVFSLLFHTALNCEDGLFQNDMAYFSSIPGYVDSLIEASAVQNADCTEDIGWNIH
ncbi:MAG: hypothetical protein ACRCUY_13185 [Thermoguttaceae bacterium]